MKQNLRPRRVEIGWTTTRGFEREGVALEPRAHTSQRVLVAFALRVVRFAHLRVRSVSRAPRRGHRRVAHRRARQIARPREEIDKESSSHSNGDRNDRARTKPWRPQPGSRAESSRCVWTSRASARGPTERLDPPVETGDLRSTGCQIRTHPRAWKPRAGKPSMSSARVRHAPFFFVFAPFARHAPRSRRPLPPPPFRPLRARTRRRPSACFPSPRPGSPRSRRRITFGTSR